MPIVEPSSKLASILNNSSVYLNNGLSRKSPFKIQFYGQSIVAGLNLKRIEQTFQEDFPEVNIEILNNSIGGYQAPLLKQTAYFDLYPEYPDLLIFHAYGGIESGELEELFIDIKSNLASEVVVFDHHISYVKDSVGQVDNIQLQDKQSAYIEQLAEKYGYGFISVRDYWKEFLRLNKDFNIKSLLRDNVHPNDAGNCLMEMVLVESLNKAIKSNQEKALELTHEAIELGLMDEYNFSFIGNKIDLEPSLESVGSVIDILIDGKKPQQIPALYTVSRPRSVPGQWWPAINRIFLSDSIIPNVEQWTITFYEINWKSKTYLLKAHGDISGFQGNGSSGKDFESINKAISFKHKDVAIFFNDRRKKDYKELDVEFEVNNRFKSPMKITSTTTQTLLQLLDNKKHSIKIKSVFGSLKKSKLFIYKP
jgi:hypothetical protein